MIIHVIFAALSSLEALAEDIVITPQTRAIFVSVGAGQKWVCNTGTGDLGKIVGGREIVSGASFRPMNAGASTAQLSKKIKLLKLRIRRSNSAVKARLKRSLLKLQALRASLKAALADCRGRKPGRTPTPRATATPGGPTATPTAMGTRTPTGTIAPSATPTPTSTPTSTPTITPTFTPTPLGFVRNPYYTQAEWKLWGEDEAPVTYNGTAYSLPAAPASRLYPNLAASRPWPNQFLAVTVAPSSYAGFWDDGYKSEDNAHTMISTSWGSGSASINLANQFIRLNIGDFGGDSGANKPLGINFTSQSTTCMGHNQVSGYSIISNEEYYYFADTVRGGPSYYSFRDHLADRTIDSYSSLPAFAFHSFGRSGSEINGLFKMLVSGGYMPRSLKNHLKHSGLYPSALLYIYKASLPYANADGTEVEYTNELRHRVGYLSNGNTTNSEFMPYNQWYHKYNEGLHFYTMTQLANSMTVAPPIALIQFISGERIAANGSHQTFTQSNEAGFTVINTPLAAGETVSLTIDVNQSFDMFGLPLTPTWTVLYPEQKNVTVEARGNGRYVITAVYDSHLPKGRIPVLFTVSNGVYESNPAVVSFYPNGPAPSCGSYELGSNPSNEMNVNYRPLFSSSAGGDLTVSAGQTAAFTLTCTDPEGFPTRYYRYLGEPGTLSGNNFSLPTLAADSGKTVALHFICSDGTGAYNSLEQKVIIQ